MKLKLILIVASVFYQSFLLLVVIVSSSKHRRDNCLCFQESFLPLGCSQGSVRSSPAAFRDNFVYFPSSSGPWQLCTGSWVEFFLEFSFKFVSKFIKQIKTEMKWVCKWSASDKHTIFRIILKTQL